MNSGQAPLLRIRLLGTFAVERGERVLRAEDWPRRKAAALLKRTALEGRLLRDQAMEFLWPDSDPVSAANNLYKALHVARRTLDSALGPGTGADALRYEDGLLSLGEGVWVDARAFADRCAGALSPPGRNAESLEAALALYGGDLLPDDRYEDWTVVPRERLYRLQREARLELAGSLRETGDYASAIALLLPLVEHDRADESAHRELMRLYAFSGRRQDALRQYRACVEALTDEINAPPASETAALYNQILNDTLAHPQTQGQPLIARPDLPAMEPPRRLFVGREREMKVLQSNLEAVVEGSGRIIFISGEAGEGKTSLMEEFAHRSLAEHPDLVIAAGACQALIGTADPYLPFRDMLAMLTGDWQRPWLGGNISTAQARRLQAAAPQAVQAIETVAPGLIDTLVSPAELHTRLKTKERNLNQQQVFDEMGMFLRALAAQQPLILLLDDLQWIDSASANLLFYLGRQLANSRILLVGAYRPSEVSRKGGGEHPLAPVVQELVRYRGEIQIDLEGSGPADERSFIDALIDSEPNQLDASFREAMYRRTKGNPLFAGELLRALQDQGDLAKDESGMWSVAADLDWGILPARVEAVIARRIAALPPELRRVLTVASVEGESFTPEVAARVHGMPARSLLHVLSQDLDQQYRLVREQGEWRMGGRPVARYQFRHNLFQQYLYNQLSAAERRNLHGEIAAALEQLGGGEQERLTVPLAQHYLAAGDAARAVPYLCRAGDEARRRVALEEAAQFYRSALDHWQGDDRTARAEVLHKLGETYLALGRSGEAIERLSEADALYAQMENRSGMGAMQRLIGRSYFEQGDRARTLEHYHRALSLLEGEPENVERARAVSALAQLHMTANQYDEAIAWGEQALALARERDLEDVILHALVTVGTSLANKGDAEQGLAMLAESQERAEALGMPHDAGRAYSGWGDALVTLERYEEARAVYERMLAYAQKVHARMFEGVALVQLGFLDWWSGRWRQLWERRKAILEWMANFPGASFANVWAANLLGLMYNDLGMPEKARAVLAEYTAIARSAQEQQTTVPHLGQLARCAPSASEEATLVQEILSSIDSAAYYPYEIMPALRLACGWLAQSSGGDPAALSRLEKAQGKMQNRQTAACLHEVQGAAAGLREEWAQAVTAYQAAAGEWEALKRPYDLLRTLGGFAKALSNARMGGARDEGQPSFEDVRAKTGEIIEQLAGELDEPEIKHAFLTSPLIVEIQTGTAA